jgi:hypothetical protein
MGADIQTPAVKIKAQDAHRFQSQLTLFSDRERPLRGNRRVRDCFSTTLASREGSQDLRSANNTSSRALVISGSKISSSAS